jgi:hypothetical protein
VAQVEQGAQPPKMNAQASALRFFFVFHHHPTSRRPRNVSSSWRCAKRATKLLTPVGNMTLWTQPIASSPRIGATLERGARG